MSRTYRRKNVSLHCHWWYGYWWGNLPKDSQEYKEKLAWFHSDAYIDGLREPGPAWFRKLYTERPQRRYNKNELRKFMLDPEYEPMVIEMDKIPYWS